MEAPIFRCIRQYHTQAHNSSVHVILFNQTPFLHEYVFVCICMHFQECFDITGYSLQHPMIQSQQINRRVDTISIQYASRIVHMKRNLLLEPSLSHFLFLSIQKQTVFAVLPLYKAKTAKTLDFTLLPSIIEACAKIT